MVTKQSWVQRNPQAIAKIQKRYYEKNKEQARLRSKAQNLRGKVAYSMLSDKDKRKCDKEVERLLQNNTWPVSYIQIMSITGRQIFYYG